MRRCCPDDIPAMARLRALEWGDQAYWETRIAAYLDGSHSPGYALPPRVCFVAVDEGDVIGFVAGHLTRRFGCDGEIQWINVAPERRRQSVASELLRMLKEWFAEQHACRICVDVEPDNETARRFYRRHGAQDLNPHWLVWPDIGVACR